MTYHAKVIGAGAVEFPEELVRELDLAPGKSLVIEREGDKLVLKTYEQVVREVQTEFRHLRGAGDGRSIVDELIVERREEARRENEDLARWVAERG